MIPIITKKQNMEKTNMKRMVALVALILGLLISASAQDKSKMMEMTERFAISNA
jgi:hypothetical protein